VRGAKEKKQQGEGLSLAAPFDAMRLRAVPCFNT
jgi:hypothetical protein